MGGSPRRSFSILEKSVSTQVTRCPRYARHAPVTVPTYPVPMTVTLIFAISPSLLRGAGLRTCRRASAQRKVVVTQRQKRVPLYSHITGTSHNRPDSHQRQALKAIRHPDPGGNGEQEFVILPPVQCLVEPGSREPGRLGNLRV